MSGIEVAGLALAVFPLCVQGLKYYAEGAKTISDMRHHRQVLRDFVRELDMQRCQFLNTCENLLEDMVTSEEREKLMEKPGDELWSTVEFKEKLWARMGQNSATQFLLAVSALKETLIELNETFVIDESRSTKRASKKLMKRFSLTLLKTYRDEQLLRIRNLNHDIDKLITGCPRPSESKKQTKATVMAASEYYKRVRDHAISLYGVLKEKFQTPSCGCGAVHNANLQLQLRQANGRPSDDQPPLRFKFVMSFDAPSDKSLPWDWREVEIERANDDDEVSSDSTDESDDSADAHPTYSTTSGVTLVNSTTSNNSVSTISLKSTRRVIFSGFSKPSPPRTTLSFDMSSHIDRPKLNRSAVSSPVTTTSVQIIQSLCNALRTISAPDGCLGILLSNLCTSRHYIWSPSRSRIQYQGGKTISLERLLGRLSFTQKDRLVLGLQLASSVLQLYKTPWLEESWGRRDVLFLINEESGRAVTSRPFLRQRFERDGLKCTGRSSKRSRVALYNKSLFSLGVVLLELWYRKPIEELAENDDTDACGSSATWNETTAYMTALSVVQNVLYDDAGAKYEAAVRRCIQGLDCRISDLENEGFKREVHEKIVGPLKENLEAFCAGDLPSEI